MLKITNTLCAKWETEHDYSARALGSSSERKYLGRMIAIDAEYSMTAMRYLKEHLQRASRLDVD